MAERLPVLVKVSWAAKHLNWKHAKTLYWMQKAGVAVKRGPYWFASVQKLRERFPEVWDGILEDIEEVEEAKIMTQDDIRGPWKTSV